MIADMGMRIFHLARCTAGAAVVEAAVVTPLAIALMAGGVEFGRAIFYYHTIDKSLRNATRYLARLPESAVNGWGLSPAKNLALRGSINPNAPLILPSSGDANTIALTFNPAAIPKKVSLTATVPFTFPMLRVLSVGLTNQITIVVQHE